ncbi:MAG: hypothetical protein BGO67_07440 [Alphaproteobacteria bacterium 41-28]|nr:MAG: hypothetical protein BGO67_07440 [Alphaproteobacteria bacterium 41-28]
MSSKDKKETTIINYRNDFSHVLSIINEAKENVWRQVNHSLIMLYWNIGQYVSHKALTENWGQGVVQELSDYILSKSPHQKGFSARNIWRMKQFYETYQGHEKLSALLTEITWSNHLHILSKTKSLEEKEFYLNLATQNRYTERDLARLIDSATFERTKIADKTLPPALVTFPVNTQGIFKDSYVFEFLSFPEGGKEEDLRKGLIQNLKKFLLELGPDFSLIGEEYTLQVGLKDFRIDILMHHRGLDCLVAIELKITDFRPEYVGKMQFYLEALDREMKKPHENPSIGILLCKTKDEEVVRYALARNISPTMIAEYETKLIDKSVLQKKLHDLSESLEFISAHTEAALLSS